MKTKHFAGLIASTSLLVIFPAGTFAEQINKAEKVLPPSNAVVSIVVTAVSPANVAVSADSVPQPQWNDLRDYTFEMRNEFFAGLHQLEGTVSNEINELTAKRSAQKKSAETKSSELAMQEMNDNHFFLTAMIEQLSRATPETWDQRKAKVGQAWLKTQEACAKVKASTSTFAKR